MSQTQYRTISCIGTCTGAPNSLHHGSVTSDPDVLLKQNMMSSQVDHEVIELLSSSDDEEAAQSCTRRQNPTRAGRPQGPIVATERVILDHILTSWRRRKRSRISKPQVLHEETSAAADNIATEGAQCRYPLLPVLIGIPVLKITCQARTRFPKGLQLEGVTNFCSRLV